MHQVFEPKPYTGDAPTRIIFGDGVFDEVGLYMSRLGANAFVMLDPFLKSSPVEDKLVAQLQAKAIRHTIWCDIVANPRAQTCDRAAALAKEQGCDFIVAVGGGSTIDAAKAVALVAVHGGDSWDYTARVGAEVRTPSTPGLPLLAVPTTAGTGAEVTPFAVLSNRDLKLKATIINRVCCPTYALIDPMLHLTKPRPLTASTGVDTFLHAFEGFVGNHANTWTDLFAVKAMQLVAQNLREACKEGRNLGARRRMAEACYLAGIALGNVGVGIPHALGQALGALKDTAHGESCAACVIPTISWTLPDCQEKLAQVAAIFDPGLAESPKDRSAAKLPALLRDLFDDIGLKSSFKSLGLDLSEVDQLVGIAFTNYGQDIACSVKPAEPVDIRRIVLDCL
jgi:alcohol dehydrogenase class IV